MQGPTHAVVRIIDGETLRLDDGTEVRLIGAMTPRMPLAGSDTDVSGWSAPGPADQRGSFSANARTGWQRANAPGIGQNADPYSSWPPAEAARRMLDELVLGRSVTLWRGGKRGARRHIGLRDLPRDRYGRVLAQVTTGADGTDGAGRVWLQAALLRAGLARAYSTRDMRGCVRQLQRHETEARQARRGLWGHASYAVRVASEPDALLGYAHTFQVVEGRVARVGRTRKRTYLNFGRHWKTDFTLTVDGRAHLAFRKAGVDLAALEGRRIRVRGWIETKDGPVIRLTHPEQIEDLGPADQGAWSDGQDDAAAPSDRLSAFDQWRQRESGGVSMRRESGFTTRGASRRRERSEWRGFTGGDDDLGGGRPIGDFEALSRDAPDEMRRRRTRRPAKRKPAPAAAKAGKTPDPVFLSM